MLQTKLVSFMKLTKDTHNFPLPDSNLDKAITAMVILGATNGEIATVLGRPNWVSESKRWADKIHQVGNVTWRCASDVMEGLYGVTKAVGSNRKPQQFYIDLAVNTIIQNPTLFANGDEWAIYPERTEGIFQDSTSWIWPNDPGTYATFFIKLADECQKAFQTIGKDVRVGLSANNLSELMSGWMDARLINRAGLTVVDAYFDGNPFQLSMDMRTLYKKFGKPIYLQESAPSRFVHLSPFQITEYFNVLKGLGAEGIITHYGFWGGWAGTKESLFDSDFKLTSQGAALKSFYEDNNT